MARVRVLVAVVVALAGAAVPSSARAAVGPIDPGNVPGGYQVEVSIAYKGEAAPGNAPPKVYVAPTCWWQPASPVYRDAVASLDWYKQNTNGGEQTRGTVGTYGPIKNWEEAAELEKSGKADLAWYRAMCQDAANLIDYDPGSTEDMPPVLGDDAPFVTYYYRAFNEATGPPAPLVSSLELARAARKVMVIPEPEVGRNPKIGTGGGQPTLVGLPTWFWVTDPEAVGGPDGDRDITATVGNVSATVTATTENLHLHSASADKICTRATALVTYSAVGTAPEANACTVQFDRASATNSVTASTHWEATWTGTDGTADAPAAGRLDDLDRAYTVNVPVAEVQNIVTR